MSDESERKPPRAPLGGRLAWWPFAVALSAVVALVLAVVLINVFAGNGTTGSRQQGTGLTASGAVACPEFFEHPSTPWVPARPAGVHPKDKLVPKLHPTHVTICAYSGPARSKSLRLTGGHELTGRLDAVVGTLRKATTVKSASFSYSCFQGAQPTYLIGMRYAEAIVWVSAPACGVATNGTRVSRADLNRVAASSYAARRWSGKP